MDQYTKALLTIITVCVVMVTLIIVGSAIIRRVFEAGGRDQAIQSVSTFIRELRQAMDQV